MTGVQLAGCRAHIVKKIKIRHKQMVIAQVRAPRAERQQSWNWQLQYTSQVAHFTETNAMR